MTEDVKDGSATELLTCVAVDLHPDMYEEVEMRP